jgi:alpha-glucoside transport system permease protein
MGSLIYGVVSIIVGVAGSIALFWLLDRAVGVLPERAREKALAFQFLTPALFLISIVLVYPLFVTVTLAFKDETGTEWVGLENFRELFGSETFLGVLLNNFLWVAVVPAAVVALGLLVATLGNNMGARREKTFKSLIFMPMSISFISAATIWSFMYVNVPPGRPEIGLLNAIRTNLGQEALPWMTIDEGRLNSFLLMVIIIWLQTGFAMVLLSAAIKAVPEETIEAAKIDGASAPQIFFRVIVPQIRGTIMAVFVTVLITVMKIFDIVLAMTGGTFNTSVLGFEWYREFFLNANSGAAAAVVLILMLLIIPLMWLQIRTVRHQESMR